VRVRFPRIAFAFACAASLALPLAAQSPNGSMNGRVVDPSNKVISGADILVISDATGSKYSGKTNDDGIYVVPNLPPGRYLLQVSKVGFKTLIKPDIVLNIQDALSINFTLPVGAAFEIVTVEGGASMINTTDASVSTVVDQSYVKNMPLNGRSFQDLILLTPGTLTQSPQAAASGNPGLGNTGEFSVNGQRPESNYYTVDGVSANVGAAAGQSMALGGAASGSVPSATALGTTQALVSVDDLQEFRVQSSTYSAQYGRNPGGQFSFETKSGTNQWHGTAYNYLRNDDADANDWFNDYFGKPKPALRQNDFGGTLGGPVEVPGVYHGKDKTFFFFSYEGLRLLAPQAATASFVPDLCMRGTGACPAGRAPASSALLPVVNAFPLPNNAFVDAANGFGQFVGSWSNPSSLDSNSIRFDHAVSDKLKFFFRFSDTRSSSSTRSTSVGTSISSLAYATKTYTAGASTFFTNRLGNDFRLNYTSTDVANPTVIETFGGSSPVDLAQLMGLGSGSFVNVALVYGGSFLPLSPRQQFGAQRQWNFVDSASLSLGRHQLKVGADYRRLTPVATPATASANYFYLSESSVETNTAGVASIAAAAPAYPLYANFSAFVQDEWRVSPRLTVSFGLRWEVNPAPSVTQGLKPYTIQGSNPDTWTLAPQGTSLWKTTWFNFAPRLGLAYMLRNGRGRETVVRGGAGVFYDTGQQVASGGFVNGPGFSASADFGPGSFPIHPAVPAIVNPPVGTQALVYGFAPHLQLPYTLQWNVSIEQALGKSQALTASYVASHGSRLLKENDIVPPINPNVDEFLFFENGLRSDYDSMQIEFRRRLSRGLTTLGSYTWSHCLDYGSQNYLVGYQRGNCDFDVRSNASAAFSYDLADMGKGWFANAVLHHWGLDDRLTARTAFPVTLNGNSLVQPDGSVYEAGLNLVPGQPVYLYGANCASVLQGLGDLQPGQGCPGGRAISPLAFADASSGLGTSPRNSVRGFGAWQMNLAVRRDFPIRERLKLQFRAEAFNVFNHPNFGLIIPFLNQPTFGQATSTLASAPGAVLNPLYQMGGARSMQFVLKLIF